MMNTVFADVKNGEYNNSMLPPGQWYGAVSASFIEKDLWITEWVNDMHRLGGIGDCWNGADYGRMYFRREKDLALFLLRWA